MWHPAWKEEKEPGLGSDQGRAVVGRIEGSRHAVREHADAWVVELKLAAHRRVAAFAAFHVVGPGPIASGMRVPLVGVSMSVDVGPALDPPGWPQWSPMPISGDPVGDLRGGFENGPDRRAAPLREVEAGMPAADVAV